MNPKTRPTPQYSQENESRYRDQVARQFQRCHKKGERLIRQSPNGTNWEIVVDDSGNISAVAL